MLQGWNGSAKHTRVTREDTIVTTLPPAAWLHSEFKMSDGIAYAVAPACSYTLGTRRSTEIRSIIRRWRPRCAPAGALLWPSGSEFSRY